MRPGLKAREGSMAPDWQIRTVGTASMRPGLKAREGCPPHVIVGVRQVASMRPGLKAREGTW